MNNTLHPRMSIIVGIPGSGKSTEAKKIQSVDPENTVIVELDEVRTALFGESYHYGMFPKKSESEAARVQTELLKQGFREKKHVISSNTNLNPNRVGVLAKLASDYGAPVNIVHLDVDPDECRRRNTARGDAGGRRVPDHIMDSMIDMAYDHTGHLKEMVLHGRGASFIPRLTPGMEILADFNKIMEAKNPFVGNAVVLVDVDGTLAANHHEANRAFASGGKKDFGYFFRSIETAIVNNAVRDLANTMRDHDRINSIVLSGREDSYAKELVSFVARSGLNASRVICKRAGDGRADFEYKKAVLDELRDEGFALVHSIDDRERSVAVYEREGIMVSRVQEHKPEHPDTAPKSYPEPRVNTIYGQGVCIRCGQPLKDTSRSIGPVCATKV